MIAIPARTETERVRLGSLQRVVLFLSMATTTATWLAFMVKIPALHWSAQPLPFPEIANAAWRIGPITDTSLLLAGLLLAYIALAWVVWTAEADLPLGLVLTTSLASGVFAVFTYALLAEDVNVVLANVWTFAVGGSNPYLVSPDMAPGNPFNPFTGWRFLEYVYGPAWLLIGGGLMRIIGPDVVVNVMAMKVLMLGTLWIMGAIAWSLARARSAEKPVGITALVVLNPLLLADGAMTPHLDLPMAAALIAALLAWVARREADAVALFALSVAIKFITALVAPLFGFGIALGLLSSREDRRRLPLTIAALALTGVAMALFWPIAWRPFLDQGMARSLDLNSVTAVIPSAIIGLQAVGLLDASIVPLSEAKTLRWPIFIVFCVAATGLGAAVAWKRRTELPYALCPPMALIMLGYHVLFTLWFLPWHLLTALCLCLVAVGRAALLSGVLITASGMLLYINGQWVWEYYPWGEPRAIYWILAASLASGPILAALVLAVSSARQLQLRPSAPK